MDKIIGRWVSRLALVLVAVAVLIVIGRHTWFRPNPRQQDSVSIPAAGDKTVAPHETVVDDNTRAPDTTRISPDSSPATPMWTRTGTVEARVKAFKASGLGSRKMTQALEYLARASDEDSVEVLLMLAEDQEIGAEAIAILGNVRTPAAQIRVAKELQKKLDSPDARVIGEAVKSYAALKRDDAIPELVAVIRRNWGRADGRGQIICLAAVTGLGALDTPAADAALVDELARVTEPGWLPDYGSVVVAELAKADGRTIKERVRGYIRTRPPKPLSPTAATALAAYANGLTRKKPGPDNPPGRKYYEEKIAEVHSALSKRLGRPGSTGTLPFHPIAQSPKVRVQPDAGPGIVASNPAAAKWTTLFAKQDWYRNAAGEEGVFRGRLAAVKSLGETTLMRSASYRLGNRTLYTGGKKHPVLDALVGKPVEIRGKAVDMQLEGRAVREIWPAAIRISAPIPEGSLPPEPLPAVPSSAI